MTAHWYVIRSKPNREEFLEGQLVSRNVEVYFPRLRANPVNPRARKFKAYFPGYLFIRVDLEHNLASNLERIPGVANLVAFGGETPDVPEHLLNAIRAKVEAINVAGGIKKAGLQPGTLVKIEQGPFEGYEGIVDERIPGKERVRVLLDFLQNRKLAVELPAEFVNTKRKPPVR